MADDPHEVQIRALINGRFYPSEYEGKPELARAWAAKAVAAVYRADPLADENRATRLIATTWVSAFGAAWEDCSPESRDMALIRAGHVLAALREVAGL